jgi:hypothetical protein
LSRVEKYGGFAVGMVGWGLLMWHSDVPFWRLACAAILMGVRDAMWRGGRR